MFENENMYNDYSKVITNPERYISRTRVEKEICSRVDGNYYGSFSLVGLPRTGKTSVANHLFSDRKNEIAVTIVLSTYNSNEPEQVFYDLAALIRKKLKKTGILYDDIEEQYQELLRCDFNKGGKTTFFDFIEEVVDNTEYKLIIVIDEFDAASELFKNSPHYFQIIREMATQDIYNTAFVFLSRRMVEHIEMKLDGTSNLRQVLRIAYIQTYDQEELKSYFNKLSQYFTVDDDIKMLYKDYTGYYPLLMDILSYTIIEEYNEVEITANIVQNAYEQIKDDFHERYEYIKQLLCEEELFDELLQIVFSMPFDIKRKKINSLRKYGIIDQNGQIFSASFETYLLNERGVSDYHKIWNRTEKGLKNLSKKIYADIYGPKWEAELKKKYQNHNLKKMINSAYYFKKEEFRKHNQPDNTSFIDTIATSGLLILIQEEWPHFNTVFEKSKAYWIEIFTPIINVRNVVQHNREEVLDDLEVKRVIVSCEEIVSIIDDFFKKV